MSEWTPIEEYRHSEGPDADRPIIVWNGIEVLPAIWYAGFVDDGDNGWWDLTKDDFRNPYVDPPPIMFQLLPDPPK